MKKLLILLVGLLVLSVVNAYAFPLYPGYGTTPGTQFEDNDLDYFIDNDDPGTDGYGVLSVGDVLVAVVEFENALNLNPGGGSVGLDIANDDLVAITQIQITGIQNGIFTMGEYNSEAMVQFYTGLGDSNLDALNHDTTTYNPTLAEAISAVKDGATHLWDFSITDDPDTYWYFAATNVFVDPSDPDAVKAYSDAVAIGQVYYGLNQVWGEDIFKAVSTGNPTPPGGDGLVDLIGSGSILGGGWSQDDQDTGIPEPEYFATSDIDMQINPIPEPATLSLFGLGLLGVAAISRRRKN